MTSGKVVTTVGYERRYNDSLKFESRELFTEYMQEDQPLKPANILNIVATNQGKRSLTMETPKAAPLSVAQVKAMMTDDHVIVDTRSSAEYGAGHIAGAYNVQLSSSEFEQRVGWVTPDNSSIILVTNSAAEAQHCIYKMAFIALDVQVAGYLEGGLTAWMQAGQAIETVPQMDVHTLKHRLTVNGLAVLDVRDKEEWDEGHIQGAYFMPYTSMAPQLDIPAQLDTLDLALEQSIAVTCATGQRSSTAISMLRRHGYQNVYNVTGGMAAWLSAKFPVVDEMGQPIN